MIYGIAHAALYTDKLDETIEFYQKTFDAENLGCFQLNREGCWLKIGDSVLEIFESEKLPTEGAFKHIAFRCDNVDEAYHKAIEAM